MQVLRDESEYAKLQAPAAQNGMTVSERVRLVIGEATRRTPADRLERELAAIDEAVFYRLPTADIATVRAEIERG